METRLNQLLKAEGLTSAKFAEILSVQPSSISHLLSGRNKPNFDFISRLLLMFPHVNPKWFINGQGDMYIDGRSVQLAGEIGDDVVLNPENFSDDYRSKYSESNPLNTTLDNPHEGLNSNKLKPVTSVTTIESESDVNSSKPQENLPYNNSLGRVHENDSNYADSNSSSQHNSQTPDIFSDTSSSPSRFSNNREISQPTAQPYAAPQSPQIQQAQQTQQSNINHQYQPYQSQPTEPQQPQPQPLSSFAPSNSSQYSDYQHYQSTPQINPPLSEMVGGNSSSVSFGSDVPANSPTAKTYRKKIVKVMFFYDDETFEVFDK